MHAASLLALSTVLAQPVVVRDGKLVWPGATARQVRLFGVNYYAPFTWCYAKMVERGDDIAQVIDRDLLHIRAMGLDLIRIHVFDREISDRDGNLVQNRHLELLSWLIYLAGKRGIKVMLTPIAWWPATGGDGFSGRWRTKQEMFADRSSWAVQARFLKQFLSHRNRYNGLRYAEDPTIVAIEPINEPLYPPGTSDDDVVAYINTLVDAIRAAGCRQPIFYNAWAGREEAVARSKADGASFVWYPTGLAAGRSLWGNFLGRVLVYRPAMHPALKGKPKVVYEFDAADVPGGYLYPAMARAFAAAGIQMAAQFQYDCLPLAAENACWRTHLMNLIYAPREAVAFAAAALIFRSVREGAEFEFDGSTLRLPGASIDARRDAVVAWTEKAFAYAGDTRAAPPRPEQLEFIAGFGSSPLVGYGGAGAYFLRRIRPGLWRLEIYPDCIWVADPHSGQRQRPFARLLWAQHEMTLRLPGLGAEPWVARAAPQRDGPRPARGGRFVAGPGLWILGRDRRAVEDELRRPAEFFCPPPTVQRPEAWAIVPRRWPAGVDLPVQVRAVGPQGEAEAVEAWAMVGGKVLARSRLARTGPYAFAGELPGSDAAELYVAAAMRFGGQWMLAGFGPLEHRAGAEPMRSEWELWAARKGDRPQARYWGPAEHSARASIDPSGALRFEATGFGAPPSAARVDLPAKAPARLDGPGWRLCLRARALYSRTSRIEVSLVQDDGSAFGAVVPLDTAWREISVPLSELRPMWGTRGRLDISRVRSIAIVFGAWLYRHSYKQPHAFELQRIYLARRVGEGVWQAAAGDGVALVTAGGPMCADGSSPLELVREGGRSWLRLYAPGFGPPPDCVVARFSFREAACPEMRPLRRALGRAGQIVLRLRAAYPQTTAVEVAFVEEDGTPWGTVLKLTPQWREYSLRPSQLSHFAHWHQSPPGRGGQGDRLHLDRLAEVRFCIGAWLFGDRRAMPHGVDIDFVAAK